MISVYRNFETKAFDDRHKHVLSPTSPPTSTTGVVLGKIHEHVMTYMKEPHSIDDEPATFNKTTTAQPTIMDFIAKMKKRSLQTNDADSNKSDYGEKINCGFPIADAIAEEIVLKGRNNDRSATNLELGEGVLN